MIRKEGRPVLDYACSLYPNWAAFVGRFEPKFVEALLRNGANPNEEFSSRREGIVVLPHYQYSQPSQYFQ
jgi:hypothetical protein